MPQQPAHVQIARTLVEKGAYLDETTWNGQTPLDLSVKYQHAAMADLLSRAEDAAGRGRPWWRRRRRAPLSRSGIRKDRDAFLDKLAAEV